MSSNVQSIVACLGDPVAGNPTQFLMQRLVASLSLDWMFITAEVSTEQLAEAYRGLQVLQFSGAAFFAPHQEAAWNLVDGRTEAAELTGRVRIARVEGTRWIGDDPLPEALIQLLQPTSPAAADDASRWLMLGDPRLDESIAANAPRCRDRMVRWNGQISDEKPPDAKEALVESTLLGQSLEQLIAAPQPLAAVILDSHSPVPPAKWWSRWALSERPLAIMTQPNPAWEKLLLSRELSIFQLMRPIDVAAAKAAVSFEFWTGATADRHLIRESLDEYCQW